MSAGINVYPGWWSDPEAMDLSDQLLSLATFDERKPVWDKIQGRAYETVPALKIGDGATITSHSDTVHGNISQFEEGFIYWNLWIAE